VMVLVDTSVWSLALRRKPEHLSSQEQLLVAEWSELVREGRVQMIGPIRQELLSGLRHKQQFALLEERLSVFPDTPIETADYLEAVRFFNLLQGAGVPGAPIDLLICAVARRREWAIFTLDADFERYARILPIRLHRLPSAGRPGQCVSP
jgi:predicted nucleic acid-binding protein